MWIRRTVRACLCLLLAAAAVLAAANIRAGGLISPPAPIDGPNLVVKGGFEEGKAGWTDNGFTIDTTVAHSGQASLRLTNANLIPYSQTATQTIQLKKGVYNLSGWIKTSGLAATTGLGMRICLHAPVAFPWTLVNSCTAAVKGTVDWQQLQLANFAVLQDTPAALILDAYGDPDGTAWIDDIVLTRSQFPIQTYLLYPNYRGILFDNQPQIVRVRVTLDLPGNPPLNDFVLTGEIDDEASGTIVTQNTFKPAAALIASLDASGLVSGRSYLAVFRVRRSDGGGAYTYPAHRIVRASASQRSSMTVSFDDQNRFLLRGKPAFLLGVYDSGMGYSAYEKGWEELLTASRRLFELPINFYLNYWYGAAENGAILPLMNVLQDHGIYNLTNANCFSGGAMDGGNFWFTNSDDATIQERSAHPAFGGFYAVDECIPGLAQNVFTHYQRMKKLDPDGIVMGTLLPDANISQWPEAVDVLATDPYALYGPEPAAGYPLSSVADSAEALRNTLQGSRPFATVIQFFKFTSRGRWPTQAELRSMSYGAIAGGANGLFYWSLGANALAYICDGSSAYYSPSGSTSWCQAKIDNFTNLKNVMTELKGLEPVLTLPDAPELIAGSGNPAIRTRVKSDGRATYLIAYNSSAKPQKAEFRLTERLLAAAAADHPGAIAVNEETFTDSLDGYGARVYRLTFASPLRRAPTGKGR